MSENYAAASRGLKLFREAMLSFIVGHLQTAYGIDWWERGIQSCFRSEDLNRLKDQFARRYGKSIPLVFRPGKDLYEVLDVNHFANVLEYNWKRVFAGPFGGDRTALTWLREIVALRNAVAHPETGDLRYDDVWRGLDTAERILHVFDEKAASEVAAIKGSLRKPEEPVVSARQWKEYCQSLMNDHPQWTEMLVPPEALEFVPARLRPAERAEPYPSWRYPNDAVRTLEAVPMPIDDCVRRCRGPLVILGGPGQGKTAALEMLTLKHAREVIEQKEGMVPVLVKLNRYEQKKRDLSALILMSIQSRDLMVETQQMEQLLGNPGVPLLLMFDGLDEVRASEWLGVKQEIESFLLCYPSCQVIITCRTAEYDAFALRLEGEEKRELGPFDENDVRRFLIDYYWACDQDTSKGRLVFEQLQQQGLVDFAQTPLHLGLIVGLAPGKEGLPENRGQLYQQFVARVLRLEAEKGKASPSEWMLIERFLAHLALVMHEQELRHISERAARQAIGQYWQGLWESGSCSLHRDRAFDLVWSSRLLVKTDAEARFRHAALQDYFVAVRLEYMVEDAEENLYRYVGEPYWDESFALLAGMLDDASQLVECVSRRASPLLTLKCLANASRVDEFVRMMAVERLLDQLFAPDTLAQQLTRLFAEVPSVLRSADELRAYLAPVWIGRLLSTQSISSDMIVVCERCLGRFAEQSLITALESADTEEERVRSAFLLGYLGSEQCVEPLIDCIYDENPDLRYFAIEALGRRGAQGAIEALKTRLSDADGDVRRVTITVLGALCGADVSPPPTRFLEGVMPLKSGQQVDNAVVEDVKECLRPALSDSDQAVQTEAAIVLGCLGEAQVTDRLIWLLMNTEFDYYQKGRIIRALGRIGTEEAMNAIPMFELEMLDLAPASDHQYINEWSSPICFEISAALSLGNSGPLLHVVTLWRSEGLSHTVEEAGSQEVSILAYRIDRLRYYSEKLAPAIVERGVKALDDLFECIAAANGGSYSESVEKEATYLLERIRKSANVEDLIRYLREAAGHDIVTKASLRSSGVEDVIYLVGKHCASWISTDRDPLLCAMLEDDRLVGLFITVHRESRWNEARLIAARALAHYVRLVGRETPMGMRACDEVVDPWLKEWEAEGEPGQYMRGLILSLCGDSRAVPLLLESLEDQEITTRFRAAALLLLEYHRDKRAITTMIDMLHDSDANRRIVAATTLGKIDDPRVTAALAGVVRDPERAVRSAAVSALQARGDESVVEPLIRALDEEDFWIREEVIDALGKIGGKRAAAALASVVLYHEDDRARGLALERLADIGDPSALEAFRRALKDEAPGVQSAATWGLRSWAANESDVENLRRIYAVMKESDSKWDRVSLVLKLRTIGTPDAARAIEHALQDPDELVRFLAILGLGELGSVAAVPALSRVVEEDTGVFQDTPLAKAAREAIEEIQKRNSGSGEHQ